MRRWSRRRFVVIDLALVVLVAAVTAVSVSISSGSRGVPEDAARLTVDARPYGQPIPASFLGLSLEYSSIETYAGTTRPGSTRVHGLVSNLNPGQPPVLRIGGHNRLDLVADPGHGQAPGITYALDDRWLQVTRALADSLRARLILGINLEADSPQIAGTEARRSSTASAADRCGRSSSATSPPCTDRFRGIGPPTAARSQDELAVTTSRPTSAT